jgi:hypothetical protein
MRRGELERARELVGVSDEIHERTGDVWGRAQTPERLARSPATRVMLSLNAGLIEEGEARARESLAIAHELRDRPGRIFGVGILARVTAERGQSERAGRLWGAIEDEEADAPLGGWRPHRETCEGRIRELAAPEFDRGRVEGRALMLDDAVSIALE